MSDTVAEAQPATDNRAEVLILDAKSTPNKVSKGKSPKAKPKTTPKTKTANPKKKQKKTVSALHPKYSQMINEAIVALKDRNGSSRQAILKYIVENYNVISDEKQVNNHVKMSLRAGVKSGKLKQSKGSGACGSYKLGEKVTGKASKPSTSKSKSPTKKATLTKVKKPKVVSKITKSPSKKTSSDKSSPASSPQKTKSSPKKSPAKTAKSPEKSKGKKTKGTPVKSKKSAVPETQTVSQMATSDTTAAE